jgi:hypothetical protein
MRNIYLQYFPFHGAKMSISGINIDRVLNTFQILRPDGTYNPEYEPKLQQMN